MRSAGKIASQLHEYVRDGVITVAGRQIVMTTERLAAYRLVLDRTVPSLSATEITHRTGMEGMTTEQLTEKLAALVKARPELGERLHAALGGRLIEGKRIEAPPADGGADGGSDDAEAASAT